ncbi:MAG: restriction endonuclease subunit S [Paludibacteraceae bacterium]|nr:restriction endonuclease subunit S [Paludibacteraceae bacterium]
MNNNKQHIPQGYKLSPLGPIPEDWEVKRLGDLVTRLTNGITYDVSVTTGKPVSRIETISNGEINYLKVGYIEDTRGLETYKMQIGDILYSHINSLAHVGKVAFYDGKQELYHGMNLLLLRANNCIDSKFLYICLLTSQAKHAAQTMAKPAVNQASISTEDIKK